MPCLPVSGRRPVLSRASPPSPFARLVIYAGSRYWGVLPASTVWFLYFAYPSPLSPPRTPQAEPILPLRFCSLCVNTQHISLPLPQALPFRVPR